MQATLKTTLRCGSCVNKVTPGLDRIAGLDTWSVDTDVPEKRLTVSVTNQDVIADVITAVEQAGFQASLEAGSPESAPPPQARPASDGVANVRELPPIRWSTYRPLFLVVVYMLAGTLYVQWATGDWSFHHGMRLFMGLFFLGFAFFKLLNVSQFADAFASYDLIAARWRGYALAYPFIELTLGVAYLAAIFPVATNVATMLVMGIGLVGVVQAVTQGRTIQCACLGTAFNLPMSSVTIIENSSMVLMAGAMLVL